MSERALFVAAALLAIASPIRADEGSARAIVMEQAVLKTRDGALLRADVYRPRAEGKWPVLLMRTPYDRRGEVAAGIRMAQRGYVHQLGPTPASRT
jgi:predicted acyl esterase